MNKETYLEKLLPSGYQPVRAIASQYAPTNIALCKYWGKRHQGLNLPLTGSLSISLADKGATTSISYVDAPEDIIILNGRSVESFEPFYQRLLEFLNLFRHDIHGAFKIETTMNIPVAAGLASSACGYAALVLALNDFYGWQLSKSQLSTLARLGSGSACRSLWHGFVEWYPGESLEGEDSFAEQIQTVWPELRVGLLIIENKEKPIPSRQAMIQTAETSTLYHAWPKQVEQDMVKIKEAIKEKDFYALGETSEHNAMVMHALMMSARPPIIYSQAKTIALMEQVWAARALGLPLFFTQDAGPNLKLLFLEKDEAEVKEMFPSLEVVQPFLPIREVSDATE